jgi:predicted dehydrogenase
MIHDLELAQSLVGSPVRTVSASGTAERSRTIDDCRAVIEYENGARAEFWASRVADVPKREFVAADQSGRCRIDLHGRVLYLTGWAIAKFPGLTPALEGAAALQGESAFLPHDRDADMLERELSAFLASIAQGTPVRVSGADGHMALRLADAIVEACG